MRTASAVPGLLIDKRLAVGIWWGLLVLIAGLYYTQSEYYDVLKEQMTGKTLDKYVAKTDYKDIGIGSPRLVETSSAFRGTAPTPTAPTTGEVDDVPSWIDFENSPVTGSNPDHLKRLYKLVRDRADPQTGIIMYTSTTSNYMDMYDNWVCSMARTQGLKLREKKKKKDKQTNKIIEGLGGVGDDPRRTSVQLPQSGPSSHNEQGERYFMSLDNVPAQSIAVTTPGPNPFEHRQRKPDHPAKRLCDDNYEVIPSEDGLLTPFKNFVVYTSDAPTVKLLQQRGDPVFTDHAVEIGKLGQSGSTHMPFASTEFEQLMLNRIQYIQQFLLWNFTVFLNDCDTVWSVSPTAIYPSKNDIKHFDIFAQDDLSMYHKEPPMACTGNLMYAPNQATIQIWGHIIGKLRTALQDAIKKHGSSSPHKFTFDEQYFLYQITKYEPPFNQLRLWFWNEDLFPAGNRYFWASEPQKQRTVPANIHNTWIVGHDAKVRRFKRFGLWFLDDQGRCLSQLDHPFPGTSCFKSSGRILSSLPFDYSSTDIATASHLPTPAPTTTSITSDSTTSPQSDSTSSTTSSSTTSSSSSVPSQSSKVLTTSKFIVDPVPHFSYPPVPKDAYYGSMPQSPSINEDVKSGLSTYYRLGYRRYSRYIIARRQDEVAESMLSWQINGLY